jgi:hypothetical protein
MIKCPKCNATLPDGAGYCQFCQSTFVNTAPVQPTDDYDTGIAPMPNWVWPAYYGVAGWWIASGLYGVLTTVIRSGAAGFSGFGLVLLLLELFPAIIGIGLLFRVELVRGIVNISCFLQILQGVLGLLVAVFSPFVTGIWGIITVLVLVLNIALALLMIYLIGETDTRAPNF